MKILSIGSDKKIFERDSDVRQRQKEMAALVSSLTIIVFSLDKYHLEAFEEGNLKVIPTNSSSKFSYIQDAIRIGREISDIDVITTQDPFESGIAGLFLKRPLAAKLQVQIHTDFLSPYFRRTFLNFVRFLISLFVVRKADRLRVVSARIGQSVKRKFKKHPPVDVLPVFADISKPSEAVYVDLHKKYPQFGFIAIAAARLEKEKNIKILLQAFLRTLEIAPDAGLVIIGDGSQRHSLEKERDRLGLKEKVKFEGWQKHVSSYYKSADLYVSTSDYEGYGLSLLEAAYSGLPIISTDVGIMGELLLDNESALVCPVRDVECIGIKMAEMRRFVDVRKRIGEGAALASRKSLLSRDNYFKRHIKLWKNCL